MSRPASPVDVQRVRRAPCDCILRIAWRSAYSADWVLRGGQGWIPQGSFRQQNEHSRKSFVDARPAKPSSGLA